MKLFTIDGMISAWGKDLGDRWNGWRTPEFPREEWESLLAQMKAKEFDRTYSERDGLIVADFCEEHTRGECSYECDQREIFEINPDGSCALGAWSWIWSAVTDHDLTEEEIREFRGGSLVHCDRPTDWDTCDIHDECICAVCLICGGYWCDFEILGA